MDLDSADPDEVSHGDASTNQIRVAPASLIFCFEKKAVIAYSNDS